MNVKFKLELREMSCALDPFVTMLETQELSSPHFHPAQTSPGEDNTFMDNKESTPEAVRAAMGDVLSIGTGSTGGVMPSMLDQHTGA
ncbi:hypothetical protein AV530_008821 [Patagioenas fasciata monilis]|uniref:Uncharacterized protein n=1 Tax=Patagioenas fasciata monilis TaxID=372326 RepID=A0A1V4JTR6_PATFA|nr:hypothetical protein AV530_008821 [Patagioenas fasciata monilis]